MILGGASEAAPGLLDEAQRAHFADAGGDDVVMDTELFEVFVCNRV
jgi:hypothetical protein